MVTTKECRILARSPPGNKQSTPKKARRKVLSDDPQHVEGTASGTAQESPSAMQCVHGEFVDPIDLGAIPEELKQKMYAAALVLLGHAAVYTEEFFRDVAGLCGQGLPLNKLLIDEDEIQERWPPKNHRYEIADCLDNDQAKTFSNHWSKVYGETPDNDYFSLRFLRGCFATFVHEIEVNWVEEALDRRRTREGHRDRNPKKLGPVALRQQISALCNIIASIEVDPDRSMKALVAAKDKLQECKEYELNAVNLERSVVEKLELAKQGLEGCYANEDSEDLNARYSKTSAEAKSLRIQGNAKDAAAKRAKAEALLAMMNEISKTTKEFEDAILEIEGDLLSKAREGLKKTRESVAKAEEKVKELTLCPGCKDATTKLEDLAAEDADLASRPNPAPDVDPASLANHAPDEGNEMLLDEANNVVE